MSENETETGQDLEMFISMFNGMLYDAGLTYPVPSMDNHGEFNYFPSGRVLKISLDGDKCKLTIQTSLRHQPTHNNQINLYDAKDWHQIEGAMETFIEQLKEDRTFGHMPKPERAENSWDPDDTRPSCDNCSSEKASYRVPNLDHQRISFLCHDCFLGVDRCALCNRVTQAVDNMEICEDCVDKVLNSALARRPHQLKQWIIEIAGDLFKEISRMKMEEIVDQAKINSI